MPVAGSLHGAHPTAPSLQGKFKVRVKALEYVGGQHVCSLPEKDRQGVIHVKPTSLSDSLEVRASVVCDVCPCEQVRVVFADVPPPGNAPVNACGSRSALAARCQQLLVFRAGGFEFWAGRPQDAALNTQETAVGCWAPILPVLSRPVCAAWLEMLAHRWKEVAVPSCPQSSAQGHFHHSPH